MKTVVTEEVFHGFIFKSVSALSTIANFLPSALKSSFHFYAKILINQNLLHHLIPNNRIVKKNML